MAFVNEFASKEDLEKYGITELQKSHHVPSGWDAWTIDRERNIILMLVGQGGKDGPENRQRFLLSRNGKVTYHTLRQDIDRSNEVIRWTLSRVTEPNYSSEEEHLHFEALYADLKDALRTYKVWGCYETSYDAYETVEFTNI